MANKLRSLRRKELLELLIAERRQRETLERRVAELEAQLADRNLRLSRAGTLAEAALSLSGVFEAADRAAALYLDSLKSEDSGHEP